MQLELNSSLELAQAVGASFANYIENVWNYEYVVVLAIARDNLDPDERSHLFDPDLHLMRSIRHLTWIDDVDDQSIPPAYATIYQKAQAGNGQVLFDLVVAEAIEVSETTEGAMVMAMAAVAADEAASPARAAGAADYLIYVWRSMWIEDKFYGVVIAEIDPRALQAALLPIHRVGDSSYGIAPVEKIHFQLDPAEWQALSGGEVVLNRKLYLNNDDTAWVAALAPVSLPGWVSYASSPVDQVLREVRSDMIQQALTLILLILLAYIVSSAYAFTILNRASRLRHAAIAIAHGDFSIRTGLHGDDDLAAAGETIDYMAERIENMELDRLRFLQVAAHELRNPMAALKALCVLMKRRINKGLSIIDLPDRIDHEINRLSYILDGVLNAFSMHQNITIKREPVNLVEVVENALKPFLKNNADRFQVQLDNNVLHVLGDTARLEEVVSSLLDNALKYSGPDTPIRVILRPTTNEAILTVHDQGVGIPEGELERIFEGFYRASNVVNQKGPGGIGLSLFRCRDIINRHGGHIFAESNSNGTSLHVVLPLYRPDWISTGVLAGC